MARFGGPGRSWGNDGEPVEKPYQLIPFFAGEPRREPPPGHGVLAQGGKSATLAGLISFSLTLLTPLHVGMGIVGLSRSKRKGELREEFAALPAITQRYSDDPRNGPVMRVPILPGSSLKGAIRSMAEAISSSCLPVSENRMRRNAAGPTRCRYGDSLCPTCRLFGSTSYASHLQFSDVRFPPKKLGWHDSPLLWRPGGNKKFLSKRYLDHGQPTGRKFYFHRQPAIGDDKRVVIAKGAAAHGRIGFHGLRRADIGLLLSALGVDPDHGFPIKVGGGKPVGLGSVRIRLEAVQLVDFDSASYSVRHSGRLARTDSAMAQEVEGRLQEGALVAWVRDAIKTAHEEHVVIPEAYERLRAVLDPEGLKKPAPDQPY